MNGSRPRPRRPCIAALRRLSAPRCGDRTSSAATVGRSSSSYSPTAIPNRRVKPSRGCAHPARSGDRHRGCTAVHGQLRRGERNVGRPVTDILRPTVRCSKPSMMGVTGSWSTTTPHGPPWGALPTPKTRGTPTPRSCGGLVHDAGSPRDLAARRPGGRLRRHTTPIVSGRALEERVRKDPPLRSAHRISKPRAGRQSRVKPPVSRGNDVRRRGATPTTTTVSVSPPRARRRHQLRRHRRRLLRRRVRGDRRQGAAGRRDEVVLATKVHGPMGAAPTAGSSRRWICGRARTAFAAAHRLDRPLPDPPAGPRRPTSTRRSGR